MQYVKKKDPFISAWENVLNEVQSWNAAIVFLSQSIQTRFYKRYCESISFNSISLSRLEHVTEDWSRDKWFLKRIEDKYFTVENAIRGLKNREWDGKSNLLTIYDDIKTQMKWIADTLVFIKEDLKSALRIGNQLEVIEIKNYIEKFEPRLKNIYAFYKNSLKKLESYNG